MTKDKRKYQGKKFINFQCDNLPVETVDEFDTFKEARAMLKEYRLVGGGYYWISQRPTKDWYRG